MFEVSYRLKPAFRIPEYREAKLTGRSRRGPFAIEQPEMGEVDTVVETSLPQQAHGFPERPVGSGSAFELDLPRPIGVKPSLRLLTHNRQLGMRVAPE